MRRLERGGRVLAPGPADTPLRYIDARDMAAWMLSAADRGIGRVHVAGRHAGRSDPVPRPDTPPPDTWLDPATEQRLLDRL